MSISFSEAELQCKQLTLRIVDAAGAEWNDDCIHIFTVGNAAAHEQFNRFHATVALSPASRQEVTGGCGRSYAQITLALARSDRALALFRVGVRQCGRVCWISSR